jgi:hypothetical protein
MCPGGETTFAPSHAIFSGWTFRTGFRFLIFGRSKFDFSRLRAQIGFGGVSGPARGCVFAKGRRVRHTDLDTTMSARRASRRFFLRTAGPVEKRSCPSATRGVASPAIHDYASARSKAGRRWQCRRQCVPRAGRAQGHVSPRQSIAADDRPRGNASQSGIRTVDLTASGRHSGAGGTATASRSCHGRSGPWQDVVVVGRPGGNA